MPVIFPDVEMAVITGLRAFLASNGFPSLRVANTYKGVAAGEVWVRRDGGPALDQVRESARLGVNVFMPGATSQPVSDLARLVSAGVRSLPDGAPIVRVTQSSGPSPIPDTLPRMYMTFDVVVRGTNL